MNKRGLELIEFETIEYILLFALGISLFLALNNLTDVEGYNRIRAEDIALTINSVYISEGDLALSYDLGSTRNVIFEGGVVRTYIDNSIRERQELILLDNNFIFENNGLKTDELRISKDKEKVMVT